MGIKVAAQRESLQMEMVKLGYDCVMTEGTSLINALVASSPHATSNPLVAQLAAERLYVSSVFGAMQRFAYPVHNLLSAAKYATNYTISQADKTVMILPHGLPELHKYTKQENMVAHIHGVTHGDPLTAMVTGGAKDVGSGTTVYVHRPPLDYTHGAANPMSEGSLLSSEVTFATYYTNADSTGEYVYDHQARSLVPKSEGNMIIRVYTVDMHSAILGLPNGPNQGTGEMLMGYPTTMVGTDVSTETGRMRLRMYLGATLYRPENVIILPDVSFAGLKSIEEIVVESKPEIGLHTSFMVQDGKVKIHEGGQLVSRGSLSDSRLPNGITVYQAAQFGTDRKMIVENTGHLGCIDSPECGDRIYGTHVYSAKPTPL